MPIAEFRSGTDKTQKNFDLSWEDRKPVLSPNYLGQI